MTGEELRAVLGDVLHALGYLEALVPENGYDGPSVDVTVLLERVCAAHQAACEIAYLELAAVTR